MIGCIIQARVGSKRLPRKVMMSLDGKNTVLHYVLKQLEYSKFLKQIVVATTTNKEDDEIINYLKKTRFKFFRGNENDVLDRYYQCAKKFSFSIIVIRLDPQSWEGRGAGRKESAKRATAGRG